MRKRRIAAAAVLALVLLAVLATCALPRPGLREPGPVRAGPDGRAVVAAGERYAAGPVRRFFLGGGHRDSWAAPASFEVLDLASTGGGLTPERTGGGNQTRSLHFRAADGRRFAFRSVDKDQARGIGWLGRLALGRLRQDQVGALHPAAAVVASGIEEAAGVRHAPDRLVVMPDDPALGRFRGEFAGMLGTFAERPAEDGEAPQVPGGAYAGMGVVVETDSLLAGLRRGSPVPVDARAYLEARLVDVYLGDWDRHEGQWYWARTGEGGAERWIAIPRDRDYALADYRGFLAGFARRIDPKIVRFDGEYRDLEGLLMKSRALDRAFLCSLSPAAWDSSALALRGALSDAAIARAVGRMPASYVRAEGAALSATLRARRDRLPEMARRFREALHAEGGCGGRVNPE